jgi:hypothetical protein
MLSRHYIRLPVILMVVCSTLFMGRPVRAQVDLTTARKFDEFGDIQYEPRPSRPE